MPWYVDALYIDVAFGEYLKNNPISVTTKHVSDFLNILTRMTQSQI